MASPQSHKEHAGPAGKVSDALGIDGVFTKLLRVASLAGLIPILVLVFQAGGTLNNIERIGIANCEALRETQAALHREHAHDRYAGIFPSPNGGCDR